MKHVIMGTAGHIDHGKTSLIKMLTNIDCDTHKEEKRRGITINLGFSYLNLPNGESVGIIDVPGHKDFINTMVGGACGIDFVLLVIAADSGIMPQTIEHMNIINALGIKKGIIALTKTDLVDDSIIELATEEISEFLKKTALENAPIIGVSTITENGKNELIIAIEQIVSEIETRETNNLFRMYVDRIFSVKGYGSVVTGSVLGGSVEVGKEVFLLPGINQKMRIRSIERHGKAVYNVIAGDRAALNLIGLKNEDFERGMLIAEKQFEKTEMVDAYISSFENISKIPLWSNIVFISGTFECQARMHLLDKDELNSKEKAIVQLHLSKPAILLNKDKFILRNSSETLTLGGGYIIDASPLHHKKRTPELIEYLNALSNNILKEKSLNESINVELKKELRPFTSNEISEKLNIDNKAFISEINSSKSGFKIYNSGESAILINLNYDNSYRDKILNILSEHHLKFQLFPNGLETNEISGKIGFSKIKSGKTYLDLLLKEMKNEGFIDNYKSTWILKGHKPLIDKQTEEEINWLEKEILNYNDEKPVISEIEDKALNRKIQKNKVKLFLSFLANTGKIQFFQTDFIHSKIVEKYRHLLLKHLSDKENGIEISEFKEIMGGTKRFRALLSDIFENEKLISIQKGTEVDTKIFITEKGKKNTDESLSR